MAKKYFNPLLFCCVIFLIGFYSFGQQSNSIWTKASNESLLSQQTKLARTSEPTSANYYQLNMALLKDALLEAPDRDLNQTSNLIVMMPNSQGSLERFSIMKNAVMHPELQAKYPNMNSYIGKSLANPSVAIYFSITSKGFHAMTLSTEVGTEYIDPYTAGNGYIVYSRSNLPRNTVGMICEFDDADTQGMKTYVDENITANVNDGMRRTYALALGCSPNYTNFHGGTVADGLAAMIVSITRVSGIYDRDFSVRLQLIGNNDLLVSTDANPIFGNNTGVINTADSTINSIIGSANYDIGHVFTTGAGGLAGLGVVCTTSKASGITGISSPIGDPFDVDYVAHEMGHQFGGSHTFNGSSGSCSGGNRSATSAYEPGSGSTIMAYAGICPGQNVQNSSEDYFHRRSIVQISNNIQFGPASNCPELVATGNFAPVAEAGASYIIPISTPYKLTGSSTDADGIATHTYTWEQYDLGSAGVPTTTTVEGPMVRSFKGTTNPVRYIPRLSDVVANGGVSTTWEKLAAVSRVLNFELTVRDNDSRGGQTDSDNLTATTDASAGPFMVTSQSTAEVWQEGSTQTITWNVANTDVAPVSATNVNILLSTDGGVTFPTALASNVANDGSQAINVPFGTITTNARIIVEGAGNIFYNVNSVNFSIEESNGFALNTTNTEALSCQPDDVVYNLTYNAFEGFNETTTFSVSDLPANATAVFNPTTASANSTDVTLTISNSAAVTPGTYTISAVGTSATETNSLDLLYTVANGDLSPIVLVSPSNNAPNFSNLGTLEWEVDTDVANYLVEIATDADFNTIIESANTTLGIYSPQNLESETEYFWRVTGSNACAVASPSSIYSFTTTAIVCETYTATDTPLEISAVGTPTITSISNINLTDATVSDVNVTINITHTWVNDLVITLTSPTGTVVALTTNNGAAGADDYTNTVFDQDASSSITSGTAPFTGTFIPEGDLSTFNGEGALGDWILTVTDTANQDGGSLLEFSLEVCVETTLSTTQTTFENFSLFPNPNKGEFTVKLNSSSNEAVQIGVYDIRGRQVFKESYGNSSSFNQVIKLNQVQAGMYLVTISDGSRKTTKKIIVE